MYYIGTLEFTAKIVRGPFLCIKVTHLLGIVKRGRPQDFFSYRDSGRGNILNWNIFSNADSNEMTFLGGDYR